MAVVAVVAVGMPSPSVAAPPAVPDDPAIHGPPPMGTVRIEPDWLTAPRSPNNASYDMSVTLDADKKTLTGHQVLRWTNISDTPTTELHYHLYYNAWRNDRSSWFRAGVRDRGELARHPDDGWAYCDVETIALRTEGGLIDLTERAHFIAPDDGNEHDRTVLVVPLSRTVAPGETIEVELSWESKVPRTFARTGFRGDYFFLAQWFPKVGVLEAGGHWNCHQFIQTEFFSDFGEYDVRLSVPEGWTVGATGREVPETATPSRGTEVHHFVAQDVHDFAWVASPELTEHTRRFEHPGLPAVDMRLLLMPDHAGFRDRYFDATEMALSHYGTWWGPYPYGYITIVDPAWHSGSGGMEYPTLFTGGTRWLSPKARRSPEGVTIHEAGHQFWYGLVANNEFEDAWLDEGFNTYSTTRTLEAALPEHAHVEYYFEEHLPVVFPGVVPAERTAGSDQHAGMYSAYKRDPQGRPSYKTGPSGYHVNAYEKGAMTLRTLENYLGWPTFQQVMSTYFRKWAFGHPTAEDFFTIAERVSGRPLRWFFDQIHGDSVVFDYAVGKVQSQPIVPRGYRGDEEETKGGTLYETHVYVRRWGEGVFPVGVLVDFEDGTKKAHAWDGKDRWIELSWTHPAKVERVRVDPDHVLVLDTNFSNNSWLADSRAPLAATKWSAKWMLFVQHTMETLAFFS